MRHGLQRFGLVEASGLAKCKVRTENVPSTVPTSMTYSNYIASLSWGPSRAMLQHQGQGAAGPEAFLPVPYMPISMRGLKSSFS
jgi:hypothetical protein